MAGGEGRRRKEREREGANTPILKGAAQVGRERKKKKRGKTWMVRTSSASEDDLPEIKREKREEGGKRSTLILIFSEPIITCLGKERGREEGWV